MNDPGLRFAFVSHMLPPYWSGQSIVIQRLLRGVEPDSYCLISQETSSADLDQNQYTDRLRGTYHHLPKEWRIRRGHRYGAPALNAIIAIVVRAGRMAAIVRREGARSVVAASGDLYDLPAAWLASRRTGAAFIAYYFDYYSHQHAARRPIERWLARRMEAIFLRRGTRVIVTNETLRDELKKRYDVDVTIIRNPIDLAAYGQTPQRIEPPDGELRIVYTGAVYEAHYDAFRNLIAAINSPGSAKARLHLYTAQPGERLRAQGIDGPVVFHDHIEAAAVPPIQQNAGILFLPLAFGSHYPEIIKTSSPAKLGEYLAAGRPILAHAPADSFVASFIQQHECGLVVAENDPAALAHAINRLAADPSLASTLAARAGAVARSEFGIETAQSRFIDILRAGGRR